MPGSTRPWPKMPTGPIVGPFALLNRDSRILTLFGTILASTDVGVATSESMPFLAENVTASLLILGSESKGLGRTVRDHCDALVRIPGKGTVESLNVSVAGGIIIAEVMRQRRLKGNP